VVIFRLLAYSINVSDNPSIVLFDGHCTFCHGSVVFIIRRDHARRYKFASLQSDYGRDVLHRAGVTLENFDTMLLLEDGQVYDRSTAALRIARHLDGLWPVCYIFIIIPRPIRDLIYNWIARNRYDWFGRIEQCLLPTPEIRSRFL
jgi:predicted DCC family thiol-disulfide oxidoreductase YuxK